MGTWSIEDPENFKLNSGMQLAGLSAKTVYKIVTVLVLSNFGGKKCNFSMSPILI